MIHKTRIPAFKIVLWVAALAPAAWLIAGAFLGWLGANPIEKVTHVTGMTTLVSLLVTLSITPLRRLTGWSGAIRLRRPLGLFAFFYAFVHFNIWFVFDQLFNWRLMVEDIIERPFVTVGFTAFLILIPLALTSTKGWMRRLGTRWTKESTLPPPSASFTSTGSRRQKPTCVSRCSLRFASACCWPIAYPAGWRGAGE